MNSELEQSLQEKVVEKWNALTGGSGACALRVTRARVDRASEKALSLSLRAEIAKVLGAESRISVTHTHSEAFHLTLAVGLVTSASRAGVGVDAEPGTRGVGQEIFERVYRQDSERELAGRVGLAPLPAWVIKEACFKAAPGNEGFTLPHLILSGISRLSEDELEGDVRPSGGMPACRIRFRVFRTDEVWVALALASPDLESAAGQR